MWYQATRKNYSKEDDRLIEDFIKVMKDRGGRYQRKEGGGYREHINGLKTYLSQKWKLVESFIFAVVRLRISYRDQQRELIKLRENSKKIFYDTELVDLLDVYQLPHRIRIDGKGIITSKVGAEKLVNMIKELLKEARRDGFEEGSNLLLRLAKGDASLSEFESHKLNS